MYEDVTRIQNRINKSIINAYGSIEKYMEMQSRIAELSQAVMPLYELQKNIITDDLSSVGQLMSERLSGMMQILDSYWIDNAKEIQNRLNILIEPMGQLNEKAIRDSAYTISHMIGNYALLDFTHDESSEEDTDEEKVNAKIVEEIFKPDQEEHSNKEESTIITLSPVNDRVLKYLSENPQAFYQLTGDDFEIVMAEIYNKLGYKVERTQSTKDGGKDIIIRKPEILGDFIYYVECKKYAAKRHIGTGIIKNLIGTISTDRVNGGILATTSYFTRDAKKYISENNYSCQIQMHDYDYIRRLLNQVV